MLNYFATSIYTYVIQVVISTSVLKFCTHVCFSNLSQVHNLYLYLLKKEDLLIFKIICLIQQTKNGKTRMFTDGYKLLMEIELYFSLVHGTVISWCFTLD